MRLYARKEFVLRMQELFARDTSELLRCDDDKGSAVVL